jgi:hypothetical protein
MLCEVFISHRTRGKITPTDIDNKYPYIVVSNQKKLALFPNEHQ